MKRYAQIIQNSPYQLPATSHPRPRNVQSAAFMTPDTQKDRKSLIPIATARKKAARKMRESAQLPQKAAGQDSTFYAPIKAKARLLENLVVPGVRFSHSFPFTRMSTINPMRSSGRFDKTLHQSLVRSALFRTYEDTFRLATGLRLILDESDVHGRDQPDVADPYGFAAPVKLGSTIMGYLKAGRDCIQQRPDHDFSRMISAHTRREISDELARHLFEAYILTHSLDQEARDSIPALLELFADHLARATSTLPMN
ncbi:MAG: hypothetical protein QM755_06350 [Luteolibacter sp.]